MNKYSCPHVLVIGAGSMGIVTGYHLSLAGAAVTFLIRPHRTPDLERPQFLYCLDDGQLKEYFGYNYITDPQDMAGATYDYVVITLDSIALRNEAGQLLAATLGNAVRGKDTKVILGSVGLNLLPWFLQASGLPAEQVTNGVLGILSYPVRTASLAVHATVNENLIVQADLAYVHCFDYGFMVDDSAPSVAQEFADLYDGSTASHCIVKPSLRYAADIAPLFAIFAACELMDWPKFEHISPSSELWRLTVAAVREIQGLSIFGDAGQQAQSETTESELAESLAQWEKSTLPLDLQAFNRYHHGGKVQAQDHLILRESIAYGEAEGKGMHSLKELLRRVEGHQ